jgi:hypothetical protein
MQRLIASLLKKNSKQRNYRACLFFSVEKLIGSTKFVGTYFGNATRLGEAAAHRGIKFLKNVTGRETPLTSHYAG